MKDQERIRELLAPLFADHGKEMLPADAGGLGTFKGRAAERGVPLKVIRQLEEFYNVTNGIPCLDSFDLHACDDMILFEFWDDMELWIGQRDMYMIRWSAEKDRFCLGDASDISFGDEYEFDSLIGLLEKAFSEWYCSE